MCTKHTDDIVMKTLGRILTAGGFKCQQTNKSLPSIYRFLPSPGSLCARDVRQRPPGCLRLTAGGVQMSTKAGVERGMMALCGLKRQKGRRRLFFFFIDWGNLVYKCTNVQMYQVQMHKFTNVQMYKVQSTNVQMYKCTNVQMYKCKNVQINKYTNVQLCKCTNVKMYYACLICPFVRAR